MHPNEQNGNGFYTPTEQGYVGENRAEDPQPTRMGSDLVEWDASEYIQHDKGFGWLALVIVVAAILLGLTIWLQQWTFAVLIVVMAIAFGYFGFRKPKVVHYRLDQNGVTIDRKHYSFKEFKAFGVLAEGAFYSVVLLPIKRLSPGVNIYFSDEQGAQVLNIIGDHLPVEKLSPDPFDMIMRRLRF